MFYHFVCRNLIRNRTAPISRCISSFVSKSFTEEYLVNSCGLTQESALKASKYIVLDKSTTTKPDSVVSLVKSYGFTDAHISKLISSLPRLLRASPEKILKPKLEYFNNIGISGPNLGKLISNDTRLFTGSLENSIIPSINFLRSLVPTDDDITVILKRLKWSTHIQCRMAPNIALLQDHGMPKSLISKSIIKNPRVLYLQSDKLNASILQLKNMGFSPSSKVFLSGLQVLLGIKKPIWDLKLEVYRSFGWSRDEVLSLFKKQPFVMAISVKNITSTLDFFKNSLNWSRDDISKNAVVLLLSMEKRIVPRSFVLQTLLSKGLISKNSMGRALKLVENAFLERFVIRYQNEVPELLKLYQTKVSTEDLVVGHKD